MEKVSLDAAAIAAAQLVHAHVMHAVSRGEVLERGSRPILTLYASYLDEVRSGRHHAFTD